jgi:hypothetical protein
MGILRRLRRPAWPRNAAVRLPAGTPPGINVAAGFDRIPAQAPETWVTHPLDLDIGEIADGYHLIARSIALSPKYLLFEFTFAPGRGEGAHIWLNMCYTADIPVSQDYIGAGDDVQYERPPRKARYAYFDFFRPDYEWMIPYYDNGPSDSDYLRNRVSRLTFDLKTGQAQLEK